MAKTENGKNGLGFDILRAKDGCARGQHLAGRLVREGDGVYRIRNRASGKLIDLMMTGTAKVRIDFKISPTLETFGSKGE